MMSLNLFGLGIHVYEVHEQEVDSYYFNQLEEKCECCYPGGVEDLIFCS